MKQRKAGQGGQATAEYLVMASVVVGIVLIVGSATKQFMPALFGRVAETIGSTFGGGSGGSSGSSSSRGASGLVSALSRVAIFQAVALGGGMIMVSPSLATFMQHSAENVLGKGLANDPGPGKVQGPW